ncbi:MAG: alpha/beta fold hydrolase [Pseudomonadota bacterium]
MPTLRANGIDIEYEESGPSDGVPILLIMGLAAQLTAWPDAMLDDLNAAGFRTIRFDNRDIGLSEKMDGVRVPGVIAQVIMKRLRLRRHRSYTLSDMAADAAGVMDALGLERAHVVGVSMGGMIAQILAATRPDRVSSLTAIMTSTNAPGLPGPRRDVGKLLTNPGPPARTEAQAIERSMAMWRLISTVDGGGTEEDLLARVTRGVQRSMSPAGIRRQTAAIIETGDLRRYTRQITVPTLVIHGDSDPLVNIAGGRDIARIVPGARLEVMEGMAHDLPPRHLPHITGLIGDHASTN